MKVLLYYQDYDKINKSGIGRAQKHQSEALRSVGINFTFNPKDDYDIAHINTLWSKSEHVLKDARKRKIPVIVHGHSTHEDWRDSFCFWKILEPYVDHRIDKMYRLADLIITPTPYSKKCIDSYGLGTKVIAISNGINLNEYRVDSETKKRFLTKFSLKEKEKFVMGVGFPFIRKGIDTFFEVAKEFPNIKFIWFGELPWIAQSSKIHHVIARKPANVIMPGYIEGDLIRASYQLASAMFFPSREETEGIVTLEALASRTPLLVRDIPVYDSWLIDGVNCHKGKSNKDFVTKLSFLLEKGDDRNILDEGYKVACERNLMDIGQQLKKAYESLLNPDF